MSALSASFPALLRSGGAKPVDKLLHRETDVTDRTTTSDDDGSMSRSAHDCSEFRTDKELLALAEEKFDDLKVLEAYQLLQSVKDKACLSDNHRAMLSTAADSEAAISDLIGEPGSEDSGWIKQSESHGGRRHTDIYYKVDTVTSRLDCRVETPIETRLLIPLISVMNESDLYNTWIPSWTVPKIGVRSSKQLQKIGRVNQILQVIGDVPWPFSAREVCLRTEIVDNIDADGFFAVILRTVVDDGNYTVPPENPDMKRIDCEGALLFRPCPLDHPVMLRRSKLDGPMILVSFKMFVWSIGFQNYDSQRCLTSLTFYSFTPKPHRFCDPHLSGIPSSILNFMTRTVIGQIWEMLLRVAEDVQDGKRESHKLAIKGKPELYRFVEERIVEMLKRLKTKINEYDQMQFIAYLQM